jgi:hypothetical protein
MALGGALQEALHTVVEDVPADAQRIALLDSVNIQPGWRGGLRA